LQGEDGEWICGFSKCIGICSAYVAELWRVFEGLTLACDHGFSRVELHVNFRVTVNSLNNKTMDSVCGWRLLQQIHMLLEMDWEVRVCHSYRRLIIVLMLRLINGSLIIYHRIKGLFVMD